MVLHHVAQRARLLIEGATRLDAEGFGHRDLHVIDVIAIPQRLKDAVGEAEDEQILHRLLAEIVIDAEDLALMKDGIDAGVELARRGQIAAEGLFNDDARAATVRLSEPLRAEPLDNVGKKLRRRGQIVEPVAAQAAFLFNPLQFGLEACIAGRLIKVQRVVAHVPNELVELRVALLGIAIGKNAGAHVLGKLGPERPAGNTDDRKFRWQKACLPEMKERRKQLALGQIA